MSGEGVQVSEEEKEAKESQKVPVDDVHRAMRSGGTSVTAVGQLARVGA